MDLVREVWSCCCLNRYRRSELALISLYEVECYACVAAFYYLVMALVIMCAISVAGNQLGNYRLSILNYSVDGYLHTGENSRGFRLKVLTFQQIIKRKTN